MRYPAREQDEAARLSAAHAEALRQREQELAATSTAAVTEADGRAAAAIRAADTAQSDLNKARAKCQALMAAVEQVTGVGFSQHAVGTGPYVVAPRQPSHFICEPAAVQTSVRGLHEHDGDCNFWPMLLGQPAVTQRLMQEREAVRVTQAEAAEAGRSARAAADAAAREAAEAHGQAEQNARAARDAETEAARLMEVQAAMRGSHQVICLPEPPLLMADSEPGRRAHAAV